MPGMVDVEAIRRLRRDCIVGSQDLVIRVEQEGDAGRYP